MATRKKMAERAKAKPEMLFASFDLGNSASKIVVEGSKSPMIFRSIMGRLTRATGLTGYDDSLVICFDDEWLVFGNAARDLIDGTPQAFTDYERYTSGYYRKLFAAALWQAFSEYAGDDYIEPYIVVSVPVKEYRAEDHLSAIRAMLASDDMYVIDGQDGRRLSVIVRDDHLFVIPEGVGTYFKLLSAPRSSIAKEMAAVVDSGFYTTNLVIFNEGAYVRNVADSSPHGIQVVAQAVYDSLVNEYHYEGDIATVDEVLQVGSINIGGCKSFVAVRDEACAYLYDTLIYPWFRTKKGARQIDRVYLTGGGAHLLQSVADATWQIVPDPRNANVMGGFEYLKAKVAGNG